MATKTKRKVRKIARVAVVNDEATRGATPTQIGAVDQYLQDRGRRRGGPVAVFMGAGASKTFGYPLTKELMLDILEGLNNDEILAQGLEGPGAISADPRRELLGFLVKLLPGKRMKEEEVPMVTGVLSLLDFSLATGQALLPGVTLDETRRARQLLERAILEVIPDHRWFDRRKAAELRQEWLFGEYCKWLKELRGKTPGEELGIITTNYDMMADLAAMEVAEVNYREEEWSLPDLARKVDFGFRWVHPHAAEERRMNRPAKPGVALYKLHGSTNWLRCPLCENLYINPAGPIAWLAGSEKTSDANRCHCSATQLEAQIVSPSFVREMREPNLIATWKTALDFLRSAEEWIVIGYSFPDEDVGIRALFTRAYGAAIAGRKGARPRITVVQFDDDARVNYESFFPPGTVRYFTGGLDLLLERRAAALATA